jgi:hypothetical protein
VQQQRDDDKFAAKLKPASKKQTLVPRIYVLIRNHCAARWKPQFNGIKAMAYRAVEKGRSESCRSSVLGGVDASVSVDNQIALGTQRRRNSESTEIERPVSRPRCAIDYWSVAVSRQAVNEAQSRD